MRQYLWMVLVLMGIMCFTSCKDVAAPSSPEVTSVLGTDAFDEADQVEYKLADGFTLDLWAPGPLLSNAVSLAFDPFGNAYVTETYRRKSSDIDIRNHADWMIDDISLQSLEDTKAFHLKKLASSLSDQNTWQEDFNEDGVHDYKDLAVQSEIVRKLLDTDGDGRADASHVFADGFNDMLTGIAAGVLYHRSDLFVTLAPDVYRFRDTNGDGDFDKKEVISTGYGVHIAFAGHDMSGLTAGHDGKIYWSIGDLGLNVVDQEGKRWKYPNQGAVMRSNPDGSDFEVYAHGLRNTQEICFDAYGNLISVDNDGDHVGERERYVHIIEGSDTGWRINWQYGKYSHAHEEYKVWMDEGLYLPYFEGQPAYIIPPLALAENGPAGLAYNPGSALDEQWNDFFFASYFTGNSNHSRLQAFKLKPKGASFEIVEEQDVINGINSTGVNFGPGGALYVNDWKESYDKKEEGRIWKLDTQTKNATRTETANILKSGAKDLETSELIKLIDHTDMRVRQLAQFELVDRQENEVLLNLISQAKTQFGKLHAVWGYGQMMREDKELSDKLLSLLNEADEHVKSQIAKVLGDAKYQEAFTTLRILLDDESDRVQFFAAEALGKIGNPKVFDRLVQQLERVGDSDPHHRHAIIYALSKLDDGIKLEQLKEHPSEQVRIGAVVALRRLASPLVASFLTDESDLVVAEAARAINDDFSIPEALGALAESLSTSESKHEAFVRRAINANLRVGDAACAKRLQQYFSDTSNDQSLRADAFWALGSFANPLPVDRVDNRYRILEPGDVAAAKTELAKIFSTIESQKETGIKAMIIEVAARLGYDDAESKIINYVKNASEDKSIRIASLSALAQLKSDHLTEAINLVIKDQDIDLRKEGQKLLNQVDLPEETKLQMLEKILATATVPEKQAALVSLANMDAQGATDLLKSKLSKLSTLDQGIKLDFIKAAEKKDDPTLKKIITEYESNKDADNKLELYNESLYGGDPANGRNIIAYHESAQCLRCHQISGHGGEVGPALDKVGSDLSREDLLLSLVDPNVRIAPGYGNAFYTLSDGSKLSGSISDQTDDEITIIDVTGNKSTFAKADISSKEEIPSGMFSQENILTKSEIRDVVAYLATLQ